jgi:Transposase DDE domain
VKTASSVRSKGARPPDATRRAPQTPLDPRTGDRGHLGRSPLGVLHRRVRGRLSPRVLARLGAKYHPTKKRYIAPHAETFRRALGSVNVDALDRAVGAWLFTQVRAGHVSANTVALALDGKSLRGSLREDGRCVHLFSAIVHGSGIVVGQNESRREVQRDHRDRSPARFSRRPIRRADAMHTQRDHARCVVEEHHADYLFQVKDNQPKLLAALMAMTEDRLSPEHAETCVGHGRTEHRYIAVADVPEGVDFPYAAQVILVYRERADLADVMSSAETSHYITSVAKERGDARQLGGHVRGHWGIENKVHYVRDWTFDEDRHQMRAPRSRPRALASLRNLAISLLPLAGAANIAAPTRWLSRDATRAAALLGV